MSESKDFDALVERWKHLKYYSVVIPLEEPIEFNGPVPFDVKINKDNIAQFSILAASYDEAEKQAWDFINGKDDDELHG
jgi:hypothetical protein